MKKLSLIEKGEILLIILACVIYSFVYSTRVIYSANITVITDVFGLNKSQVGLVTTGLFISYGVGQLINGLLVKKYNTRVTVFIAAIGSATMNIIFPLMNQHYLRVIVWVFNGVFQSFFYSSLTCLASRYLTSKNVNKWLVGIGSTNAIGCFIAYGVSAIFARSDTWKYSFYIVASLMLVAGVIWFLFIDKVKSHLTLQEEKIEEDVTTHKSHRNIYIIAMVFIFFGAICTNLLKDGLMTWVPTYLKESFSLQDSISILIALLLPTLSFLSVSLYVKMSKKISSYPIIASIFMGIIVLMFVILLLGGKNNLIVSSICLIVAGMLSCGVNSIILDGIAFSLRKYENAGKTVAIGDSFCYIGSALSGVVLGAIIDNYGTDAFLISTSIIALFELMVFLLFSLFWKKKIA